MLLRPKGSRSLPTYRGRAGAPPTIANARRWGAGRVLALASVPGARSIAVLYSPAAKPPHPPPPQGEGGRGEGGAPTTATKRPKGEGRRRPGRGGARPGERRPGPPDRARAERSRPDPQGRAGSAHPEPNKTTQFCLVRAGGTPELLTKLVFCWVRPVVAAAELWRRSTGASSGGRLAAKRGGTTTPPLGVTCDT